MSNDWQSPNPYASPVISSPLERPDLRQVVRGRLMAPAIALIVVASIGIAVSLFNVAYAIVAPAPDPAAPEFVRSMQRGSIGPLAAAIQSAFVVVNLLIIAGGAQMLRFQTWGLGVAASILAMVNFGTC